MLLRRLQADSVKAALNGGDAALSAAAAAARRGGGGGGGAPIATRGAANSAIDAAFISASHAAADFLHSEVQVASEIAGAAEDGQAVATDASVNATTPGQRYARRLSADSALWQRMETRAHMEAQLARLVAVSEAAASSGGAGTDRRARGGEGGSNNGSSPPAASSADEEAKAFVHWLRLYASFLARTVDINRARAVCSALLAPVSGTGHGCHQGLVCGVRARKVLVDVVMPALRRSSSVPLQRLCREFTASASALDAEERQREEERRRMRRARKRGKGKRKRKRKRLDRGEEDKRTKEASAGGIWARSGARAGEEPARKKFR